MASEGLPPVAFPLETVDKWVGHKVLRLGKGGPEPGP
jgi:hypothetical protein